MSLINGSIQVARPLVGEKDDHGQSRGPVSMDLQLATPSDEWYKRE